MTSEDSDDSYIKPNEPEEEETVRSPFGTRLQGNGFKKEESFGRPIR